MSVALPFEVTETWLLGGRVKCYQPARGYRTAIDAVILAAAVPAAAGERVLDVGTGAGASAFCLAARIAGASAVGLEMQPPMAELAARGIVANGFSDRVSVVIGDLLHPPTALTAGSFDHVMANPPYMPAGRGHPPPDPIKAAAMVEGGAKLADWLAFCAAMVKLGGTVTIIHRAERLDEVRHGLGTAGCGCIEVVAVTPTAEAAPKRVVVRARKGAAGEGPAHAPLVVHVDEPDTDGGRRAYTAAAQSVLRDGEQLI